MSTNTRVNDDAFVSLAGHIETVMRGREPAHDFLHVTRVLRNGTLIAREVTADVAVVRTAALLHELVSYKKNDPRSHLAGDACAVAARELLIERGESRAHADAVADAIADHAFSKGAPPKSLESAVLQDADRLDAIGAIGIARCFATCAEMGGAFYSERDPLGETRALDDKAFALDHFKKKLFLIEAKLHTAPAKRIARERTAFLHAFVAELAGEIT